MHRNSSHAHSRSLRTHPAASPVPPTRPTWLTPLLSRARRRWCHLPRPLAVVAMLLSIAVVQSMAAAVLLPISDEIPVNTTTTSGQGSPSIAADADGNFVVGWISFGQDGDSFGIFGRRFAADGTPASGEFAVNTTTTDRQVVPSVAMNAAGDFVISWQSRGQDGSGEASYVRVYNADGTPATGEVQLHTTTLNDQSRPTVGIDSTGAFVAAWQSDGQDGDDFGIYARRFDTNGMPISDEFPVSITTSGEQAFPSLAMTPDGRFTVVWQSDGQDGSLKGIFGRRYNADGTSASGEFPINEFTANDQFNPVVAMNATGSFAVTWESNGQDGDSSGIYARRFNADGTPATPEVAVNTTTANAQRGPAIVIHDDGSFVVAWASLEQDEPGMTGSGVYLRRFAAAGTPTSGEQLVNTTTPDFQELPELTADAESNPLVVWQSAGQDGDSTGVYARRYVQDDPPTISSVADTTVIEGAPPLTVNVTIADDESAAAMLNVTVASNNPGLIPDANLNLSGSGTDRTLTITPVLMQTGTATITLTVDDGVNDPVMTTFTVTVTVPPPDPLYLPIVQR